MIYTPNIDNRIHCTLSGLPEYEYLYNFLKDFFNDDEPPIINLERFKKYLSDLEVTVSIKKNPNIIDIWLTSGYYSDSETYSKGKNVNVNVSDLVLEIDRAISRFSEKDYFIQIG